MNSASFVANYPAGGNRPTSVSGGSWSVGGDPVPVPSSAAEASSEPAPSLDDVSFWNALGDYFTGNTAYAREKELAQINNQFNAEQAQIERDWSERMSNTAYQRAVADLEKAGLNKTLLYGGGSGGGGASYSTPSGARGSGASHRANYGVAQSIVAGLSNTAGHAITALGAMAKYFVL